VKYQGISFNIIEQEDIPPKSNWPVNLEKKAIPKSK
jgi:hypothetical protein